jgi:hypothetical protein
VLSSLSGRLLTLTVATVMAVQVAILVPTLVNFRHDWLTERLAMAHVASLAVLAAGEGALDPTSSRNCSTAPASPGS